MKNPGARPRAIRLVPALFLALSLVFVGAAIVRSPPPIRSDDELRIDPAGGALLGAWMNASASGLRFSGGEIRESFGVFRYAQTVDAPDPVVVVELHHRDAVANPVRRTARFSLRVTRGTAPEPLLDAIEKRLRDSEAAFHWIEAGPSPPEEASSLGRVAALKVPVAWFLLAQAPLWLALAYRRAGSLAVELSRSARYALAGAVAAAAVARWVLAPLRLVMLYVGYQLTAQAIALQPIPRYGAGVPALHHVLLRLFPADHRTTLVAHAILGVAIVPLIAALAHAIHRRARTTVAAAYLWALIPAFVAHDDSEALTVPALFFMMAGLVLLAEAVAERRPLALTGAAALLSLAMMCRPELPILVPVASLAVVLGTPGGLAGARASLAWAAPLVLACAVLVAPHVAHVVESAALLRAQDSLPMGASSASVLGVSVLDPRLYPAMLLPLAAVALAPQGDPDGRARAVRNALLLSVAAVDFAVTRVDLDPANVLRVQVPGALFFALAAASGVDRALSLLEARFAARRAHALAGALVTATALSALPCFPAAFRRTNEDEEEAFVRTARAALPPGDPVLVRLGYGDVEGSLAGSPVHLYFPDYLFSPPGAPRRVRDIVEWERDPTAEGAYFYLGVRCYTPERAGDLPEEARRGAVPMRRACREIVDRWGDGAVVERDAQNHGDPLATGYYGGDTSRPMHLALIRLRHRDPHGTF
jgi:hypothetical protein